jgi:hypothetical protein
MLAFSAKAELNPLANRKQHPENLFTAATETVIELEVVEDKPALFARITALFGKKQLSDDARFSDVHQAVELVATEQQEFSTRTDKALDEQAERLTPQRLKQVVLTAMAEVNAELYPWRAQQELRGFNGLADVPAEQLAGRSVRLHHYENAVWCWARAVLNERYQDFDATAAAAKRGEELEDATGDLWRDARWAVSRVQNAPHCTVELI